MANDHANTHTHKPASLYDAYGPAEARRLLKRLEFHYTPKHGSWLNPAEIELSVLNSQCLNRRIPSLLELSDETAAWQERRNQQHVTIPIGASQFETPAANSSISTP